jgi:hypothetical protein
MSMLPQKNYDTVVLEHRMLCPRLRMMHQDATEGIPDVRSARAGCSSSSAAGPPGIASRARYPASGTFRTAGERRAGGRASDDSRGCTVHRSTRHPMTGNARLRGRHRTVMGARPVSGRSASRLGALSLSCEGRPLPSSHAIAASESIALAIAQYALGSCPALARRARSTADGAALEHRTRKVESIFGIDPMLIPLNGASFRRKPGPLFAHADLRFRNVR